MMVAVVVVMVVVVVVMVVLVVTLYSWEVGGGEKEEQKEKKADCLGLVGIRNGNNVKPVGYYSRVAPNYQVHSVRRWFTSKLALALQ